MRASSCEAIFERGKFLIGGMKKVWNGREENHIERKGTRL